jgi:short-subunit dehydrogenase
MNINGIPRWPLVWITGAGTGIGRATALRLAEQGSDVVISGRRREILQQVADDAKKAGYIGRILPLEMDVTQPGANQRALDWIEAQWRLPDLVVFNAGNHTPMTLDELSVETCRSLMDINFLAVMAGLEAVLPRMRKRGHGQVACVASLASYRGLPTAAAYGASKAALVNACEALAVELQGSGVQLQVVNPGFVRTPLTDQNPFDMPQLISPEEAAYQLVKGLGSRRFEIRFPSAFARTLALLRMLPYGLYFKLIKRSTGF